MDPALDEALIRRRSTQRVLPFGERAHESKDGFGDDESDRREVQAAKPWIEGEAPSERDAGPNCDEPEDNEQDEGRVNDEDRVGERGCVHSAAT